VFLTLLPPNRLKYFSLFSAAARVVRKGKHYIKGCQVLVSLLPETEGIQLERSGQSEENGNSASNNVSII